MRWSLALLLATSVAVPARAQAERPAKSPEPEPALGQAELRLGYGLSLGGSGGMTTKRTSPLTIAAIASIAINEEPRLAAYGGLTAETLDRYSVGAVGGVRLAVGKMRLTGGGAMVFAPYTLWGATAAGGACRSIGKKLGMCGDLQLTAYFAGSDLADGHTVTQVQAVLGMVFDAF